MAPPLQLLRNRSHLERVVHLPHDSVCAALGNCLCSRQTRTRSVLRAVRDGVKERSTESSLQRFPATLTLLAWGSVKVPEAYLQAPELQALISQGVVFASPEAVSPAPQDASPAVSAPPATDAPTETPQNAIEEVTAEPAKAAETKRPRRAGSEG